MGEPLASCGVHRWEILISYSLSISHGIMPCTNPVIYYAEIDKMLTRTYNILLHDSYIHNENLHISILKYISCAKHVSYFNYLVKGQCANHVAYYIHPVIVIDCLSIDNLSRLCAIYIFPGHCKSNLREHGPNPRVLWKTSLVWEWCRYYI